MWGEIDPPVKTQPSSYESEDKSELPEEPATPSPKCDLYRPTESQQPRQDGQVRSPASAALAVLTVIVQLHGLCLCLSYSAGARLSPSV